MNDYTLNKMSEALSRLRKISPAAAEKVMEQRDRHSILYSITEEQFDKSVCIALRRNIKAGWCRINPGWEGKT